MLLINLAEPEWISVDCNESWANDVLCEIKDKTNYYQSNNSSFPLLHACFNGFIFLSGMCYSFLWNAVNFHHKYDVDCPKGSNIFKKYLGIESFQNLFNAVDAPFPPILSSDFQFTFTYDRYLNIYRYKKHPVNSKNFKGFYICSDKVRSVSIGNHLFKCFEGTYIMKKHICDGVVDCPGVHGLDEWGCQCEEITSTNCKWMIKSKGRKICSPFYYLSFDGTCQLFQFRKNDNPVKIQSEKQHKIFKCDNGFIISSSMVNDSIPDCGPNAGDEFYLQVSLHSAFTETCISLSESEIPCIKGHPKCFNISQICIYSLNEYGHLVPCRTGGHLENCEAFQCNMMYKCPGYYCIPWNYVCDGKWDCPSGLDEQNGCNHKRGCNAMYKCKNSQMCIHLGSICDGLHECPHRDDENLCEVKDLQCPNNCKCLLCTLLCQDTYITNEFLFFNISYEVVFLEKVPISYSRLNNLLLENIPNVRILTIKKCNLSNFCFSTSLLTSPLGIDFSYNLATALYDGCFHNLLEIRWINLDGNVISTIQSNAFSNLHSLKYLRLLDNNLLKIAKGFVINSNKIILLSLRTLIQSEVDKNAFAFSKPMFLHTNDFRWSCIITHQTKCNIQIPWYTSCSSLLFNTFLKLFTVISSILILFSNMILTIIKKLHSER